MRILIIDPQGASLDWALRCKDDGHQVKWYIPPSPKTDGIGKGLIELVSDPRDWFKWAELIFMADNTKWVQEVHQWKLRGWPVIGPSPETTAWELDRDKGQKILRSCGIQTMHGKEFSDYDRAIAHVKKTMGRFVSKPSGDADKALSYCSKSAADMVFMLERWKKAKKFKAPFILQEFCPGTEMAVGAWCGPGGFVSGWCENFEFKKLMNDDMGVATGEQGTVLRYVEKSKLADKVLKPVEDLLIKDGYTGYVDVNCIIDDAGTPWPLEFTMRPGWPTFNIQQALHMGDHAEWLLDLAEGRDGCNWVMDEVAVGVVLSIPDYPYSHLTRKEVKGIPVYGIDEAGRENIHPCEMTAGEAPHEVNGTILTQPCLVTCGDYVLVATGTGETVMMAKKSAYHRLRKLEVPNSPMYRTDIGRRLKEQLPVIQRHGYAKGMRYS